MQKDVIKRLPEIIKIKSKRFWRKDFYFQKLSIPLRKFEADSLEKYGDVELKHQPVFIIGQPRTGSTILYQGITNICNVIYLDNLTNTFFRNIFFGMWLSNKLYKWQAHNNYANYHGSTKGLHAPAEGPEFWRRWLSSKCDFVEAGQIPSDIIHEMRREIVACSNYHNKPFVFKLLSMGQRLQLLKEMFPQAHYIYIKRDIFSTAQSNLLARRKFNTPPHCLSGGIPKNYQEIIKLNDFNKVAAQLFYLKKQIEQDSKLIPKSNFQTINLEDLCENPEQAKNIAITAGLNLRSEHLELPKFVDDRTVKLSAEEARKLQDALEKYTW